MKHPFVITGLAAMILASSCNKVDILRNERAIVEAEILQANEAMRDIDAKFHTLQSAPIAYGLTLERHLEEAVKKNAKLEAEQAFLTKKCTEGEAALSKLRPRLESYKAKYLY